MTLFNAETPILGRSERQRLSLYYAVLSEQRKQREDKREHICKMERCSLKFYRLNRSSYAQETK